MPATISTPRFARWLSRQPHERLSDGLAALLMVYNGAESHIWVSQHPTRPGYWRLSVESLDGGESYVDAKPGDARFPFLRPALRRIGLA